ncbi:unnamed protein product, partial [Ectocarpus sp. 12 AP-2014]
MISKAKRQIFGRDFRGHTGGMEKPGAGESRSRQHQGLYPPRPPAFRARFQSHAAYLNYCTWPDDDGLIRYEELFQSRAALRVWARMCRRQVVQTYGTVFTLGTNPPTECFTVL